MKNKINYWEIYRTSRYCIADDEQFFKLAKRKLALCKVLATILYASITVYGVYMRHELICYGIITWSFIVNVGVPAFAGFFIFLSMPELLTWSHRDYKTWKNSCIKRREVAVLRHNIAEIEEQMREGSEKDQLANKYEA